MIKNIFLFCVFAYYHCILSQEININNTITNHAMPKLFTGAGIGEVLSGLNFELEEDTFTIKNTYWNTTFLEYCKKLGIAEYRFPAGTIGNYYHFYGKGSGLDSSEIVCNETYYGIPNPEKRNQIIKSYVFEKRLQKNYAYYFVDFLKNMKNHINDIGFYYHLNSHTHIYQGHLKSISNDLQTLFTKYFNNNHTLLNATYDSLMSVVDTNQIKTAINVLNNLKNDTAILTIKNKLLNDANFQYYFQENINSVRYFVAQDVGLKGIEIGNETEAEYMLFDDDFTHYQYQCGVVDTHAVNPFTKLLFSDFLEGIFKNWLLATLYADTIHQLFDVPIGMTVSGCRAGVGFSANHEPYLINPFGTPEKKAFFWSKFFALEPKIDALIPHYYTQKIIDCETYNQNTNNISFADIENIIIKYIEFNNKIALPYHFEQMNKTVLNKPLWITEWNFNMRSIVSNTFLHAYYLFKSIDNYIEMYEKNKYNIQSWLLHYLSAPYFAFALIKSNYTKNGQYLIDKILPYEAYYIWNQTLQNNSKKINAEIESVVRNKKDNPIFINEKLDEIYIHFTNISDTTDHFNLSNVVIKNIDSTYTISHVERYLLKAASSFSTNFTDCQAIKNNLSNLNYQIIADSSNNTNSVVLPPKSFGRITLKLIKQTTTTTAISESNPFFVKIFPNPTSKILHIKIADAQLNKKYEIHIINILGKVVANHKSKSKDIQINIQDLSKGTFVIKILDNCKNVVTQKFVVE